MRKFTLTLAAAATALAAGGVAHAQSTPAGPRGEPMTRAAVEQRTTQMFDRMDANGDGVLNAEDRAAREQARFDRLDADDNGAISPEEFSAHHQARGERPAMNGGEGERMGRRGGDHHRMARFGGGIRGMTRMADADQDGSITKAEFQAAALARFDQADADSDGTISAEERKAQRDTMRERFKQMREARQQG